MCPLGKTSSLCSEHFTADNFQRPLNTEVNLKRDLKQDQIGVCVLPSIHAKRKGDDEPPSKSPGNWNSEGKRKPGFELSGSIV